ncbi:hypothetical protein BJ508DRAFT_333750 [Ascobolus immersus RN42]|uniref:DUF4219 domain-containing protein n=1 Tax=Ascobolus immersus RN42 TaxID=1160509 RepID=A0A3N4HLK9_ASCIM|nr:hypothetical protein BJ508DRAFT_333750 [Ascobolus immersus RN42]
MPVVNSGLSSEELSGFGMPGVKLVNLNSENYDIWSPRMEAYLAKLKVWYTVHDVPTKPTAVDGRANPLQITVDNLAVHNLVVVYYLAIEILAIDILAIDILPFIVRNLAFGDALDLAVGKLAFGDALVVVGDALAADKLAFGDALTFGEALAVDDAFTSANSHSVML